MKKTYISPLCEICQTDCAGDLLTASIATKMELPDDGIWDNPDTPGKTIDPWNDPNTEEDDWGF